MNKGDTCPEICQRATDILKTFYGENAVFRDGQYEAIEATLTRKRTLVVQRTGWGKSLVYFICTKLLREENRGVTMVVSPLLVLMKNQLEAADKLGLTCEILNSTVKERREEILAALERDEVDLLLVTPETLFSADVQQRLPNIRIGLFVIDEAHCISDWGHDFRLEYGNLRKIVYQLPENVPVLATTATANDRVIADLQTQLGENVFVSRGPLTRNSLYIQVVNQPSKTERYAWILETVPKLPGSGIIYCLTQRDCDYLADFLKSNGISAEAYYSRNGVAGEELNRDIEERFSKNRLKVIVATIKLGMGYDKDDISFVIHYQRPSNIVSYYQQIGRAGRNIDRAYIFLMHGKEDEDILNYFIDTAFPTEAEARQVMELISQLDGVSQGQILSKLNIRKPRIDKALTFLQNDGFIRKEGSKYYITPKRFVYNGEYYDAIRDMRKKEMKQKIKSLTDIPNEAVKVRGNDPIRPYYIPKDEHEHAIDILKVKPKVDTSKCTNCKTCAHVCPLASIDFDDITKYVGKCIKCGACVKKCPEHCRYYDDEGYLYHQHDLEKTFERRAEPELFY